MKPAPEGLRPLLHDELVRAASTAARGLACHLVGGALRDAALALPVRDHDFVVPGDGRDFVHRLASKLGARLILLGGDRFAAYRLVAGSSILDVWGRGTADLDADLRRRDFTVNAMALDTRDGDFVDPFSGWSDVRGRTIRAVTAAGFLEDPLRVLRAVRFALTLPGFAVAPETLEQARRCAPALGQVAAERVRDELGYVMATNDPAKGLLLLQEVDLFPHLWTGAAGSKEEIDSIANSVSRGLEIEQQLSVALESTLDRPLWLHAFLAHTLGDRQAERARQLISDLAQRRLLTRSLSRRVQRLIASPSLSLALAHRRFLAAHGESWPEAAVVAALVSADGRLPSAWLSGALHLVVAEGPAVTAPRPLLDGTEVQRLLAVEPGPQVGRVLERLLAAQLEGRVANRAEAVTFVRRLARG